jgi:hypothetical protein
MAKATVKEVRFGKTTIEGSTEGGDAVRNIYCQSKSGNVYALCTKVPEDVGFYLMERIRKAGVIDTTNWVKVHEGEKPQLKPRISKDRSFWVRDTEGRPTQVHVRGGLLIAGGAA